MRGTLLPMSLAALFAIPVVAETSLTQATQTPLARRAGVARLSEGLTNKAWFSAGGLRGTNAIRANLARAKDGARAKRMVREDVGPHHQTWKAAPDDASSSASNRFDAARSDTGARVVSIGSGMNYWDGEKWTPSDPSFAVSPDGDAFVANKLHYKVRLEADDLNRVGSLTVTTPEGHVLRSTPVAIGLYDAESGRSHILAGLRKCPGVLVSSNSVVYENAFNENGVRASVVYTAERGSFAADVVLTAPLDPSDYGFPQKTSRIQIYTEYYNPPEPDRVRNPLRVEKDEKVRQRMVSPDLIDETLGFGEFVFSGGRVYATGTNTSTACLVAKEFKNVGGRTFMIESVEWPAMKEGLQAMTGGSTNRTALNTHGGSKSGYAMIPNPPERGIGEALTLKRSRTELASITPREIVGVVIDPVATLGGTVSTAKVFEGDTTFFVAQPYYCNGPVTMEGGAVFKYPNSTGPNATTTFIQFFSSLTCKTTSYRPAIFTAGDDDSIGITLSTEDQLIWADHTGSTIYMNNGVPTQKYYANPALIGPGALSLSNCRFLYANVAVRGFSVTVNHAQFVKCLQGISIVNSIGSSGYTSGYQATLNNCLLAEVTRCVGFDFASSGSSWPLTLKHCTLAGANQFVFSGGCGVSVNAMNSIFANVPSLAVGGSVSLSGSYNGFYPNSPATYPQFGSNPKPTGEAPFQASGAGHYYLAASHPFRGWGTTAVGTTLLKTRTTQPPIEFPAVMGLTGDLTLFPQVPRYTGGPPDLGYHYDALDHTFGRLISDGARITILPGTAIGVRDEFEAAEGLHQPENWLYFVGFELWEGSTLVSHGTPEKPNTFATVRLVQEGPFPYDAGHTDSTVLFSPNYLDEANGGSGAGVPVLDFRFSNFYLCGGDFQIWTGWDGDATDSVLLSYDSSMDWTARDCAFYGGKISFGNLAITPGGSGAEVPVIENARGSAMWINNLFERVDINFDINLDPVAYGIDGMMDFNLKAFNNLFRTARIRLQPRTSGENWAFRDNLFDKIVFQQDTDSALDHNNNGYWRATQAELDAVPFHVNGPDVNSATLLANTGGTSAPSTDKLLTSVPAYQPGPLGSYYLPASGPLFNGGSQPPGDAGLFHYTTRLDQTKEGSETGNVNIGLHYVATASSSSTAPKQTDSDGIPDYVENWHGDGDTGANRIHGEDETDWNVAMTDGSTTDSLNAVYDDIDLDGDGMVGVIEKLWSKNTLSADNPLSLGGLSTSIQGIQEVPIGLPLNAVQDETGLQMMVVSPNQPGPVESSGAELVVEGAGVPKFIWNTAYDSYGENFVFLQKRPLTEHRPVQGPIKNVSINNAFQVIDPFRRYGDNIVVEARTIYSSGYYRVSFFDQAGNQVTYSEDGQTRPFSITGQADANGCIDVTWDLWLPDNTRFTGESVKMTMQVAAVEAGVAPDGCGPSVWCPPFNWVWECPWAANDRFVTFIASQKNQASDDRLRYAMYLNAQGPLVDPAFQGLPFQLNPESQYYPNAGWPTPADVRIWTWLFTGQNKSQILERMGEQIYRNLFYLGHGNTDRILTLTDSSDPAERIFQSDIATALGNAQLTGQSHPYRFVFLYACCTGRGNMCEAFGIPKGLWSISDFARRGLRPRAFIGNENPDSAFSCLAQASGGGYDPGLVEKQKLTELLTKWRRGEAQDDVSTILNSVKQHPLGGLEVEPGIDPDFIIHGAADLTRSSQP